MNNQNHPYHDDQSFWGANQNHSSNQHTVGNRQGFSGLQMPEQYQLGWFSNHTIRYRRVSMMNFGISLGMKSAGTMQKW